MKSVCFFSSYFTGVQVPEYVKYYLTELQKHFTEVVFLFNEHVIDNEEVKWLSDSNIQLRALKNEGFDFGMWHKAFAEFNVVEYERVALVNDSCILFTSLDDLFTKADQGTDMWSITDSNAVSYHLQSYFLVINSDAIQFVKDYFMMKGIVNDIGEVIRQYEIGLSEALIRNGYKIGSVFSCKSYHEEFNPMLLFGDELIDAGIPVIKKKLMCNSFRNDELLTIIRMQIPLSPSHYIKRIEAVHTGSEKLRKDLLNCKISKLRIAVLKVASLFYTLIKGRKVRSVNFEKS